MFRVLIGYQSNNIRHARRYQVIGLRRGWAGVMELIRDKKADNSDKYMILTEEIVNKAGRTGEPLYTHHAQDPVMYQRQMFLFIIRINTTGKLMILLKK